ncbi:substrate-binding domain-containing protein [Tessaracoccus coleopterorum]|uniref:substrate-binding domain-containing protein n=1 Tax=Tessaracoccus coleopterorum TaxID=2714950 RepID=UPI002F917CC6
MVSDNVGAGRIGVDHLISTGRRNIAILGGDITYGASEERSRGAMERLAAEGLAPLGGAPVYGAWSEEWGRAAMRTTLAQYPEVDGVLCGNDQIARARWTRCATRVARFRVRWPWSATTTGPFSRRGPPALTSIDMNLEDIGRKAAQRLAEAMDGHPSRGVELLAPRLVVRNSSVA